MFTLPILYQDDLIIVINKPAGLPVHAGSGGGETLEDYLPALQGNSKHPLHLAHRLDRDTSGCLILGRTKQALRLLGRYFEHKRIHKTYWALVDGVPAEKRGRIALPLVKKTADKRRWHMQVDHINGQEAITDYSVLASAAGISWLEMKPHTGRTHQLRVHCAAMGWPIIGDAFYGPDKTPSDPLMLHAAALMIPALVPNGATITVQAPPPQAFIVYQKRYIPDTGDPYPEDTRKH